MSEERRAERGALAARSGERPAARPLDEAGDEITVDEGDARDPAVVEADPASPAAAGEAAQRRALADEPGTGRRPRGRMTLRIPDDEVVRPSSPAPSPEPVVPDGPIAAHRIITIGAPISEPPRTERRPSEPDDDAWDSAPTGSEAWNSQVLKAPQPTLHKYPPSAPNLLDDESEHTPTVADVTIHDPHDGDDGPPASVEIPISSEPTLGAARTTVGAAKDEPKRPAREPSSPDIDVDFGETDASPPTPVDEAKPEPARAHRPMAQTIIDPEEELDVESMPRISEPGEELDLAPEDVVSVESVPKKVSGLPLAPKPSAPVAAPPSSPSLKAARPAPPPAPRVPVPVAPRPPLIIVPGSSPLAPPPMSEAAAAMRRRARPWWEEMFNDDFIRTMSKITDDQIAAEVDFIEDSLGVAKGAMVLDLGCGTGRHAIELTRRGYQVVGFDLSLAMLAKAADEAQDRNQKLNFVQGDMREMTFEETFDGVYSWCTSFGFFEEEKNEQVIINIRKALKKGGQFLLDVANRDFVAQQAPSLAWFEGDGCVCMDEMQLDWITSRMRVKRTMMMDDGRSKEIEYSIRLYTLSELGKMLHDYGFRVADVSGRITTPGVYLGSTSPRNIILAEKR